MAGLDRLIAELPTEWLDNYVTTFEAGRVQRHPHARFVNAAGECCLVAALAGVRSAAELTGTELWRGFSGSVLEELSVAFERGSVRAHEVYDEALMVLAGRASAEVLLAV